MGHLWQPDQAWSATVPNGRVPGWKCSRCGAEVAESAKPSPDLPIVRYGTQRRLTIDGLNPRSKVLRMTCDEVIVWKVMQS